MPDAVGFRSSCPLGTENHCCVCCVCASPYNGVLTNWRSFSSTFTIAHVSRSQ